MSIANRLARLEARPEARAPERLLRLMTWDDRRYYLTGPVPEGIAGVRQADALPDLRAQPAASARHFTRADLDAIDRDNPGARMIVICYSDERPEVVT